VRKNRKGTEAFKINKNLFPVNSAKACLPPINMATRIRLIDKLVSNSKRLFLIDGLGACLTAFFLVAILARFEDSFGMPRTVLYFLSLVACIYAIYSFCCHFFISSNWRPYLKAIAIANAIYCCLTFGLVIYFYPILTILGLLYFLLEIIVVSILVLIELKALSGTNYN
jgi:hypothetical protein